MSDCCTTKEQVSDSSSSELCPSCNSKSKKVKIITLKSMLKPTILSSLNANSPHYFCLSKDCDVVYFDADKRTYLTSEIKVSVHQKDNSFNIPVCYCFDWTKKKLNNMLKKVLLLIQ